MDNIYAPLSTRIKAVVVDSIIIIVFLYSATYVFSLFESVPDMLRIMTFLFIFTLYEPILVSVYGATIGHFFNDIEVKNINDRNENISFHLALIRYVIKFFLGWISFLTVHGNEQKQALHDIAANSVVVPYKKRSR